MSLVYDMREGDWSAVDTKTALSTQGSNSSPGPMIVPTGRTKIKELLVAIAWGIDEDDAQKATLFLRIEGNGITEPQVIAVGGNSNGTGTELGEPFGANSYRIPVDFDVKAGNQIMLYAECVGSDVGGGTVGVGVGFV